MDSYQSPNQQPHQSKDEVPQTEYTTLPQQSVPAQQNETKVPIYGWVIGIFLVIIALLAGAYWFLTSSPTEPEPSIQKLNPTDLSLPWQQRDLRREADAAREAGDFVVAAQKYEEAAQASTNTIEQAHSYARAAVSHFLTGDLSGKQKGIEQLQTLITTATDVPAIQAQNITDLASLVCGSGCDGDVAALVFGKEPFSALAADGDIALSVRRLYEWALGIYPLPEAYVRAASWYADQLLLNSDINMDTKIVYMQMIADYNQQAEVLFGKDTEYQFGQSLRSRVSFHFWRGFAYGALAFIDPQTHGAKFEDAYEESIRLGEQTTPGSNANLSVQFAYYQYAALLNHIYGDARKTDVEANLEKLMADVRADTNQTRNQFLQMADNELNNPNIQHGFIGLSLYELADTYPAFKTFLESYGLSLAR
jgi:hypothetical protein